MRRTISSALLVCAVFGGGCDSESPSGPSTATTTTSTTTTTTAPPSNRAPSITSATVSPASGIATLTTHAFSASANDPDGDAITYSWDFGNGTTSANSSASITYNNLSTTTYQTRVTVRDSRGESASATVAVTSATFTGTWRGNLGTNQLIATTTQFLGGVVTGSWEIPSLGIVGEIGPSGEPGKVQANSQFELRFKVRVGSFSDFYYRGTMNPAGTTLTGTLQGSGFTGQVMVLNKL